MAELSITTKQAVRVSVSFALLIIGFGLLSSVTGWPDKGGWGLAVILSLIIAALPLLGPLLAFLSETGAVVDFKGLKLDFRAMAVRGAPIERSNFQADPGVRVTDSYAADIAEAANAARSAPVVSVDLGTGRSWFSSRLFVLAAAAQELRGAEAIVILAQQGTVPGRLVGWVRPDHVVIAFCQQDERYGKALNQARSVLQHLRLSGGNLDANSPEYKRVSEFLSAYSKTGDLALVPVLIRELQDPTTAPPASPHPIELPGEPSWLSREEAERLLDPWLIWDNIRDDQSEAEKRAKLACAGSPFLAVTETDGRYRGMIDVTTALRRAVFGSA